LSAGVKGVRKSEKKRNRGVERSRNGMKANRLSGLLG